MSKAQAPSNARYDMVEQRVFDEAIRLFAEQGFGATSLQQVAASVGVSRPTLYYYFKTKDQLLEKLVGQVTAAGADAMVQIAAQPLDPIAKIRLSTSALVRRRINDPLKFRALDRCESDLNEELAAVHRKAKRTVLHLLIEMIDAGQAAGVVRPVDSRVAALGIIGMCNWSAWWYSPDGSDPEPVINELTDMALCSIAINGDPQAWEAQPGEIITHIRTELARLEKML